MQFLVRQGTLNLFGEPEILKGILHTVLLFSQQRHSFRTVFQLRWPVHHQRSVREGGTCSPSLSLDHRLLNLKTANFFSYSNLLHLPFCYEELGAPSDTTLTKT